MTLAELLTRNLVAPSLLIFILILCAPSTEATHLRYGTITWFRPYVENLTVSFQVDAAFRRSFDASWPNLQVGQSFTTGDAASYFFFGDGTSAQPVFVVTAFSAAADWIIGRATFVKLYNNRTNAGNAWVSSLTLNARISNLLNNADGVMRMACTVPLHAPILGAPLAGSFPIVNAIKDQVFSIVMPAVDIGNLVIQFRLATSQEASGTASAFTQPIGFAIDKDTGVIAWDTRGRAAGFYNAQIIVSNPFCQTAVDLLILVVDPASFCPGGAPNCNVNQTVCIGETSCSCLATSNIGNCITNSPPFFLPPTPLNGFNYCVPPGVNINFTIVASDSSNQPITMNNGPLMLGATLNAPVGTNPVSVFFSWTPTTSQVGKYFICFTAVDNQNTQAEPTCVVFNIGIQPTAPSVTSLDPAFGYYQDSTTVLLNGQYPSPAIVSCKLGTAISTGTFQTYSRVLCRAPPVPGPGPLTLVLEQSNFCDIYTTNSHQYSYYFASPQALVLAPAAGQEYQNTTIQVVGSGFFSTNRLTCRFGTIVRSATYLNFNAIQCVAPPLPMSAVPIDVSNEGTHYSANLTFRYQGMGAVIPLFAPNNGGGLVTVTARNPPEPIVLSTLRCGFDQTVVTAVAYEVIDSWVGEYRYFCPIPPHAAGNATLFLLDGTPVSNFTFFYYQEATDVVIATGAGWTKGGETVVALGNNFFAGLGLACRFNQTIVPATFLNTSAIQCVTPSFLSGWVLFSASNRGIFTNVQYYSNYYYFDMLTPTFGPSSGGQLVTFTGNFTDSTLPYRCRFGATYNNPVVATRVNDTTIVCTAPRTDNGTVTVQTSWGFSWNDARPPFYFIAGPTLKLIVPPRYVELAATAINITINGTDFADESTMVCRWNDNVLARAYRVNVDQVACETAPVAYGFVNLEVANNFTYFSIPHTFRYLSVGFPSPLLLPQYGGTMTVTLRSVVIPGNVIKCDFDGAQSTATLTTAEDARGTRDLTCTIPSHALGVGQFTILNDGGWNNYWNITYFAEATVTGASPSLGPASGGTAVTILGSGFENNTGLACMFSTALPVPATYLTSTSVLCTSPTYPRGGAVIAVSNNGVFNNIITTAPYTYYDLVEPQYVPDTGGWLVINGNYPVVGLTWQCLIGIQGSDIPVPATRVSTTRLVCQAPPSAGRVVTVSTSNDGIVFYGAQPQVTYVNVGQLIPFWGYTRGGQTITAVGRKMLNNLNVLCQIGTVNVTAVVDLTNDYIMCQTPAVANEGNVSVTIFDSGVELKFPYTFTYYNVPNMTGLYDTLTRFLVLENLRNSVPGLRINEASTRQVFLNITSTQGYFWMSSQSLTTPVASLSVERDTNVFSDSAVTMRQLLTIPGGTSVQPAGGGKWIAFTGTINNINIALDELMYTAKTYHYGPDALTFFIRVLTHPSYVTATYSNQINVTFVNNPPSFVPNVNISTISNVRSQIANWATNISTGAPNEGWQSLTFRVTVSSAYLFAVTPTLSATGFLDFTTHATAVGTGEITIKLFDSGGTENGGRNSSASYTIGVTVAPPDGGGGEVPPSAPDPQSSSILPMIIGAVVGVLALCCLLLLVLWWRRKKRAQAEKKKQEEFLKSQEDELAGVTPAKDNLVGDDKAENAALLQPLKADDFQALRDKLLAAEKARQAELERKDDESDSQSGSETDSDDSSESYAPPVEPVKLEKTTLPPLAGAKKLADIRAAPIALPKMPKLGALVDPFDDTSSNDRSHQSADLRDLPQMPTGGQSLLPALKPFGQAGLPGIAKRGIPTAAFVEPVQETQTREAPKLNAPADSQDADDEMF
eukprot:TRINITY_DN2124_c0_g1_i1.p1 TRINITY_DN2124_c0_g1~~TRINITY_DN2124_c0_g1_i1.p1  ORF type:complete len:1802 (+),score=418.32 TRINITY_DN2124_c0_g1_i1:1304-6709(+)